MRELREFMRSVEGTDDIGMKRAACCLTIQGNGSEQGGRQSLLSARCGQLCQCI